MHLKNLFRISRWLCLALFFGACSPKAALEHISFGKDSRKKDDKKLLSKNMGFIVYDPSRKQVVFSHQRHTPFIPASVTKVATVAAALKLLGPSWRFTTELGHKGPINKGILKGTLFLRGGGDPFLQVRDLMHLALALRKQGITNVQGTFVFDDSLLPTTVLISTNMEEDADYNPGISALSSGHNFVHTHWKNFRWGAKPEIFLAPHLPLHKVSADKGPSRGAIRFTLEEEGRWLLRSSPYPGGYKRLPVKQPSLFTAHTFRLLCRMRGIRLPIPQAGLAPAGPGIIARHHSRPLLHLADITLAYSNNLMAELLLLQTVAKMGKKVSSLQQAAACLTNYYRSQMKGINWQGLYLANGSGLSIHSRITPEQLLAFLCFALHLNLPGTGFEALLSPSGLGGSLLRRLHRPATSLRVWAKTGTIFYGVALTGVLYTHQGRRLLFAIMVSDEDKRARYDRLKTGPTREAALRDANRWLRETMGGIDAMVTGWIRTL